MERHHHRGTYLQQIRSLRQQLRIERLNLRQGAVVHLCDYCQGVALLYLVAPRLQRRALPYTTHSRGGGQCCERTVR